MKIITFASWKGGTGKTSLTTACIETLAKQGKSILVIDLDSNLSISSIYDKIGGNCTSVDLLNGTFCIFSGVPTMRRIYFIPSDLKISRLNNISDRVLKNNLKKLMNTLVLLEWDYIFIDPPGTMNALTRNAMIAADKIIIPSMFSDIDFQATKLILEEMEMCGVTADVQIVLNRFDEKRSTQGIEDKFREDPQFKDFLWSGRIPAMRSISRLTSELSTYSLVGKARQIIENFVDEVIK
jgi:chromosome partitioning protein